VSQVIAGGRCTPGQGVSWASAMHRCCNCSATARVLWLLLCTKQSVVIGFSALLSHN